LEFFFKYLTCLFVDKSYFSPSRSLCRQYYFWSMSSRKPTASKKSLKDEKTTLFKANSKETSISSSSVPQLEQEEDNYTFGIVRLTNGEEAYTFYNDRLIKRWQDYATSTLERFTIYQTEKYTYHYDLLCGLLAKICVVYHKVGKEELWTTISGTAA